MAYTKTKKMTKTKLALDIFRSLKTKSVRTKYGNRCLVGKGTIEGHKAYAVRYKTKNGCSVTKVSFVDCK